MASPSEYEQFLKFVTSLSDLFPTALDTLENIINDPSANNRNKKKAAKMWLDCERKYRKYSKADLSDFYSQEYRIIEEKVRLASIRLSNGRKMAIKAIHKIDNASPVEKIENSRVRSQVKRAIRYSCEATLTIDEWMDTLEFFDNKCGYCGGPYEVLEHFIPLSCGGGTTKDNCVPSCVSCNSWKSNRDPSDKAIADDERMVRVKEYIYDEINGITQ